METLSPINRYSKRELLSKKKFSKINKFRKVSTYGNSINKNPLSLKAEFYSRGHDLGLSTATIYRYWR